MGRSLVVAVPIAAVLGVATVDAALAGPRIGVEGGLSIAGARADHMIAEPQSKLGFGGGVSADFALGGSFSIQPGLLYVTKGFSHGESQGTDPNGNPTGTYETLHAADYLEIPVLLARSLPDRGALRSRIYAGPDIAFEVRERLVTTGARETSADVDNLKNTDYGLCAGVGLGWKAGGGVWELDARYDYGAAQLGRGGGAEARSWAVLIMAGCRFALGD
jgi:hypothetical protein